MSLRNLKLSQLFRTIGTIFMIWFIIVFSLLLEPFQCYEHPNQVLTLKHMSPGGKTMQPWGLDQDTFDESLG